mmetsp:Transcript_47777/g.126125  ORF Transcript_47777/g.126125 Transcript_47777/m.126125 type:complete len:233 (-) Transcript_47777:1278-1976(-)
MARRRACARRPTRTPVRTSCTTRSWARKRLWRGRLSKSGGRPKGRGRGGANIVAAGALNKIYVKRHGSGRAGAAQAASKRLKGMALAAEDAGREAHWRQRPQPVKPACALCRQRRRLLCAFGVAESGGMYMSRGMAESVEPVGCDEESNRSRACAVASALRRRLLAPSSLLNPTGKLLCKLPWRLALATPAAGKLLWLPLNHELLSGSSTGARMPPPLLPEPVERPPAHGVV